MKKYRVLFSVVVFIISIGISHSILARSVVKERLFPVKGKIEVTPVFSLSFADRLTEHMEAGLSLSYNFLESLSLEVSGSYFIQGESGLTEQIRVYDKLDFRRISDTGTQGLVGLTRLTYLGYAGILWCPIYGKMNVASEFGFHHRIYFNFGAGYGGTVRQTFRVPNPNSRAFEAEETGSEIVLSAGAGFQIMFIDYFGLKIELRDLIFKEDIYILNSADKKVNSTETVHIPLMRFGFAFMF